MKITPELIESVGELAQLQINNEDIPELQSGMQTILDLAAEMQAADTNGVEPVANPLDATQRLRPDEVTEPDQRALFQSIAPATQDGLYMVPKVVD